MKINRDKARKLLAACSLEHLREEEVLKILLDEYWWFGDEAGIREAIAEGRFPKVEERIIKLIAETEQPEFPLDRGLEPFVLHWLIRQSAKYKNEYFENKLKGFGFDYEVEGEIENVDACPCCGYLSIAAGEDGICNICPVCFWENFGEGPNHLSLAEAQANFRRIGAMDERSLSFVDPQGKIKYSKRNL